MMIAKTAANLRSRLLGISLEQGGCLQGRDGELVAGSLIRLPILKGQTDITVELLQPALLLKC